LPERNRRKRLRSTLYNGLGLLRGHPALTNDGQEQAASIKSNLAAERFCLSSKLKAAHCRGTGGEKLFQFKPAIFSNQIDRFAYARLQPNYRA
jgi:hypothetical protein